MRRSDDQFDFDFGAPPGAATVSGMEPPAPKRRRVRVHSARGPPGTNFYNFTGQDGNVTTDTTEEYGSFRQVRREEVRREHEAVRAASVSTLVQAAAPSAGDVEAAAEEDEEVLAVFRVTRIRRRTGEAAAGLRDVCGTRARSSWTHSGSCIPSHRRAKQTSRAG